MGQEDSDRLAQQERASLPANVRGEGEVIILVLRRIVHVRVMKCHPQRTFYENTPLVRIIRRGSNGMARWKQVLGRYQDRQIRQRRVVVIMMVGIGTRASLSVIPILHHPRASRLVYGDRVRHPFTFVVGVRVFVIRLVNGSYLPSAIPLVAVSRSYRYALTRANNRTNRQLPLPTRVRIHVYLRHHRFFHVGAGASVRLILPCDENNCLKVGKGLPVGDHTKRTRESQTTELVVFYGSRLPFRNGRSIPAIRNDALSPRRRDISNLFNRAYDQVTNSVRLCRRINVARVLAMFLLSLRVGSLLRSIFRQFRLKDLGRQALRVRPSGMINPRNGHRVCQVIVRRSAIRRRRSVRICQDGRAKGKRTKARKDNRCSLVRRCFTTVRRVFQRTNGQGEGATGVREVLMAFYRYKRRAYRILPFCSAHVQGDNEFREGQGKRCVTLQLRPIVRRRVLEVKNVQRRRFPILNVRRAIRLLQNVSSEVRATRGNPRADTRRVVCESAHFFGCFRDASVHHPFNTAPARCSDRFQAPKHPGSRQRGRRADP